MKTPIYMDYHASTPVDPRVLEAMLPYFNEKFGNAASRSHAFGWTAEEAVERSREEIAKLIGAIDEKTKLPDAKSIVFTSGASESDNLAIKGVAEFYKEKGNHIITTKIEHKAVLDTCKRLEKEGYEVTYLDVDKYGMVSPERAMTDLTPPELDVPNALSMRSASPGSTGMSSISGQSSGGSTACPSGTEGLALDASVCAQFGMSVGFSTRSRR